MEAIVFSQASLLAFLTCRRRFQLGYLDKLSWPDMPFTPQQRAAIEQGQNFHQLLERYLLCLPVTKPEVGDGRLQMWWRRFEENVLPLPSGRALPELRLTVPAGDHFLTGRFDLVIIGNDQERPLIHIYDWKTSKPKTERELEEEWQSKLYLAMVAESRSALVQEGVEIHPEQIALTYWYVTDPQIPRTITYSKERHEQNWGEINSVLNEIESCLKWNEWPLTENWSHCRSCVFGTYCGRFQGSAPSNMTAEDEIEYEFDTIGLIEPESP